MKKYLLLGLLFMLLAPLPVSSAKYVTLLVNYPYYDCVESDQNIYSFEGGTFCGIASINVVGWEKNIDPLFVKALLYKFDDNQTQTRLHINLSNVRIEVSSGYDDADGIRTGSTIIGPVDITNSEFISNEITIDEEQNHNYIFVDIYNKKSVNIEFLGDGLSAQLRDNMVVPDWVEDYYSSRAKLVYVDRYNVLDQKSGPLENVIMEGYSMGSSSLCINGFDWASINKALLLIVDGDTIKEISQYREVHRQLRGEISPKPVITVVGNGVELKNVIGKTVYAKLVDVPDEFEQYPVTYKINGTHNLSVKSVDKSYSGNLQLEDEVIANYLANWKIHSIGEQAMLNCKNITSLYIPSSVEVIDVNALSGMTSLEQINVNPDNKKFESCDGVLFTKSGYTLRQFPIAKATQYEVPAGTKAIGRDAFYQSNLTSITLPSSIIQIGYDAFGYCTKLKEINIPTIATTFGEYAFDHCTSLTSVTLPKLTELPNFTFNYCSALTTIDLPSTITKIGEGAFTRCTKLASVVLPSITELSKNVFNNCTSLTNIVLPASLQSIGEKAFNNCTALNAITCWMENPIALPDNAFPEVVYNNASLKVPVASVEKYKAANGWKNFKNIVGVIDFADAKVKAICVENWDTNGDSEIDLEEAAAVTNLGALFRENKNIKKFDELRYFIGLTKIDDNAFRSCTQLQSVVVPASVTEIGKYAFYACYALTGLALPEGLKTIGDYAISACTNLPEIVLPSTLTTIKSRAFYYNKKLASISIPAAVTNIGASAFSSCSVLLDVTANMQKPCAIASNVFSANTFDNATLTVPYGAFDIYKSTDYWSKFATIKMQPGHEAIAAAPISIVAGESADMILRLQENLPAVSFQFDLTLASGMTLESALMIPSTDFVVSTAKVGTNKWRILAYSPSNKPISSNVGNLMSLTLQTEEFLYAGTRNIVISNFIVTYVGQGKTTSKTLDGITTTVTIVDADVTNAGKGDVNLDGVINVQDIVVLINHILGSTPNRFNPSNADANADGVINVADVSAIVLLCMPNSSANAAPTHAPAANMASLTWDTTNGLALTIDEATSYVAAQMDVTVDGTLQVNDITTTEGHTPVWQKIGENLYRVLVFSNSNDTFSAFGPHLFFDVQGEGDISLSNALLVDAAGDAINAAASSTGFTTGISTITTELLAPADVYNMNGQLIRRQATSLKDLTSGIYIVNGKKMTVK